MTGTSDIDAEFKDELEKLADLYARRDIRALHERARFLAMAWRDATKEKRFWFDQSQRNRDVNAPPF